MALAAESATSFPMQLIVLVKANVRLQRSPRIVSTLESHIRAEHLDRLTNYKKIHSRKSGHVIIFRVHLISYSTRGLAHPSSC
jgi:hypothetical protein